MCAILDQDVLGIESASMEWTDEKHSLYLKSMETSFVNQLYSSIDLLGWCSQPDMPSPEAVQHQDVCTPSGEVGINLVKFLHCTVSVHL